MLLEEFKSIKQEGDFVKKDEVTPEEFKAMLDSGENVDVYDAGYSADFYSVGDLVKIGYMEKHVENGADYGLTDEWFSIEADINVTIYNEKYKKGDETPKVEVDRS